MYNERSTELPIHRAKNWKLRVLLANSRNKGKKNNIVIYRYLSEIERECSSKCFFFQYLSQFLFSMYLFFLPFANSSSLIQF